MTWPTASERELSGQWEDNVYYEAQCYMTRKQAVSGRIIDKDQES